MKGVQAISEEYRVGLGRAFPVEDQEVAKALTGLFGVPVAKREAPTLAGENEIIQLLLNSYAYTALALWLIDKVAGKAFDAGWDKLFARKKPPEHKEPTALAQSLDALLRALQQVRDKGIEVSLGLLLPTPEGTRQTPPVPPGPITLEWLARESRAMALLTDEVERFLEQHHAPGWTVFVDRFSLTSHPNVQITLYKKPSGRKTLELRLNPDGTIRRQFTEESDATE